MDYLKFSILLCGWYDTGWDYSVIYIRIGISGMDMICGIIVLGLLITLCKGAVGLYNRNKSQG